MLLVICSYLKSVFTQIIECNIVLYITRKEICKREKEKEKKDQISFPMKLISKILVKTNESLDYIVVVYFYLS